ncbi:hypothetical protein AKO1_010493 [Acrasis kona]|uniref:Uncharacterized protein n=1 Tax=Acrasis kona TaxID=1008807 RepID=A0AAW2ZLC3_9EUKA
MEGDMFDGAFDEIALTKPINTIPKYPVEQTLVVEQYNNDLNDVQLEIEHDSDKNPDGRNVNAAHISNYATNNTINIPKNRNSNYERTFFISVSGVARIAVVEEQVVQFEVVLHGREEKMDIYNGSKTLVASIVRSPSSIVHTCYKVRLPSGARVARCTKRFKPSTERKFNYRKSDTRDIFKMKGLVGSYDVIKNLKYPVASMNYFEEEGKYKLVMNVKGDEVFHIVCIAMIGVIDHMASLVK